MIEETCRLMHTFLDSCPTDCHFPICHSLKYPCKQAPRITPPRSSKRSQAGPPGSVLQSEKVETSSNHARVATQLCSAVNTFPLVLCCCLINFSSRWRMQRGDNGDPTFLFTRVILCLTHKGKGKGSAQLLMKPISQLRSVTYHSDHTVLPFIRQK